MRFTVLASGSAGNASLIETGDHATLLDMGLGPRALASRFRSIGASWDGIRAVVLTHVHSDHWNENTLRWLVRKNIVLHCHPAHVSFLAEVSAAFASLKAAGMVREYLADQEIALGPALCAIPVALRHDGGETFGFRFTSRIDLFGDGCSLAYAADLGSWDEALVRAFSDVELLALEFNHDVAMEHASGRSPRLIARVLGDDGHLSNEQAAALLQEILRASAPGRLQHLIQLHLSRDCNLPGLARQAALGVLAQRQVNVDVHTAAQHEAGRTLHLGAGPITVGRIAVSYQDGDHRRSRAKCRTPHLPGMVEAL